MTRPVLKDDAFLADVRAANREDDNFRLWWLGQSGFLVQWKGSHLLLDPVRHEAPPPCVRIRCTRQLDLQPQRCTSRVQAQPSSCTSG